MGRELAMQAVSLSTVAGTLDDSLSPPEVSLKQSQVWLKTKIND